jgi:peptidoglycan/xylan/chitin deacetylase (PgdA/CDA1 family)
MSRFICLMYHDVRPAHEPGASDRLSRLSPSIRSYSVTTEQFQRHMDAIGRDRWVDPGDLRHPAASGDCADRPRVLLTFDDGWTGSILETAPILQDAGAQAIVFVTTGLIGHSLFASESLLRELPADTFEIGSHTVTHPFLAECSPDVIRRELNESRLQLEDLLGRCVDCVSIPNGSADARVLAIAKECGYELVFTSEATTNTLGDRVIGRVAVRSDTTVETIGQWTAGHLASAGWRRRCLNLPRRVLGPERYRQLRKWALGEEPGQDDMSQLVAEHQSASSQPVSV